GGRLATRRADDGLRFDHGAPWLAARDPGFAACLDRLTAGGHAAPWPDADPHAVTGLPGMSAIPKALAAGLDIRQGAMVTALKRQDRVWHLGGEGFAHQADLVVLAIPAPQARDLLGADHPFAADLAQISYHACVTLMAGLDPAAPRPFVHRRGQGALHQIWQDGAKPGRADLPLIPWVAHADPDWSMAHIDLPFAELADLMAPLLLAELGADAAHLHHRAAHRWLYARTDRALGRPFLADDATGLVAGGDWALGPDAAHAWDSGQAMAAHLLARP
ncbi:NAD(P)/FAD-dependent oxidoreductase, partial [Paracoccus liaowanqingii]|uniref:NAD(P)/FAD-dependent oxidoreductase n=1 Tax=Paracoccus liaowanqingii TaxID=2560053 RepID=UPI00143D4232